MKSLRTEAFIDFKTSSDSEVIAEVKRVTNSGPHAVIVIAASAKPYEDAMRMCRTKGTVVAVGLPSNTKIRADVFDTVVRNLTVKGSYVYISFLMSLTVGEIVLIQQRRLTSWLEER